MTFKEYIFQDKLVLVDFFATWCGPCQTMAPVLESVKARLGDTIGIIKIDVDKNQQVAAAYQIRSVPTFILFKNGKLLWRHSGMISGHDLGKIIQNHRQQNVP